MMEVDQRETLTQLAQSENISVAELLRRIITEGITKRTLAGDQGGKQRRTKINTPWVSATMISVEIADHLLDRLNRIATDWQVSTESVIRRACELMARYHHFEKREEAEPQEPPKSEENKTGQE